MPGPFGHGLIVGKFYPPHLGHLRLITQAAVGCHAVTVLVMAARSETLPVQDRVAWLRAACAGHSGVTVSGIACDVPVDFGDPVIWAAQVAVIRAALDRDRRPPVDAVFTSEDYGPELARRLGADHVAVDPARRTVPVSGSRLRADLSGHWEYLADAAQAALAARVVVVGAESTGTSTIAAMLAMHYRARGGAWGRTRCVTEAGRDYTITKWQQAREAAAAAGRPGPPLDELEWTTEDFDAVAAEQTRRENQAAAAGSPLVVCDTDAFATSVWERRYLGGRGRGPQPWATSLLPPRDVYLLTSHEGVPWQDDGLREGDLAVRAAMTGWFAAALTAAGHSWVLLTGTLEERLALATRVTDYALSNRCRFGTAITDGTGTGIGVR
jgi:HTH-type transcriptional regulator, transcriptional repressor of NAD biosynthesis genes